ncbi:hypothetical protein B566_EDAN009792 [Ephemera danica]|nr:hypothetical protein B566_EDAN009792 [Ephemera danica]
MGDWPNTYTFSKMLAENLVTKYSDTLPAAIFRPSIVIATHREPIPGWLDNLNGPAGITVGSEMGTIRCMRCDSDLKVDLTMVYNFVSSAQRPITWQEYTRICSTYAISHPPEKAMWYYCLMLIKNPTLYRFMNALTHDLPAQILDILYGKIAQFTDILSYFTTRQWEFSDHNVRALHASLNEVDKVTFPFDISSLRWEPYLNEYMAGIRVHLLKEQPENLPAARKNGVT